MKGWKGMYLSEALFLIWTLGVMLWWVATSPESAPQQAALAGQALVLICAPYCTLSVLQRSWASAREPKEQEPVLELRKEASKST